MKAYHAFILIALSLCSLSAPAQDYVLSARSKRIFSPSEIRALIKESAYVSVKGYQMPRPIFDSVYPTIEQELWIKSKPVLMAKFRWIENGGSTDDADLYKRELYRGVNDVLLNDNAFRKLLAVDQSDRILRYYSEINVKKDGWISVTEHIRIYNGNGQQSDLYREEYPESTNEVNNDILRGLVRDFPTVYTNTQGLQVIVPFHVKSIYKNGKPENYTSQQVDNGTRLLIGEPTVYLLPGVFDYDITYETRKQLIFHNDKDELYWNVNGTGWVFSADSVICKITFPAGAKIFEGTCYTGEQGSTAQECSANVLNDSTIFFAASRRLNSYEGLTVAAAVQKGILIAPSSSENFISLVKDNWPIPAMLGVFIFIFSINFRNWKRFGKDPEAGTIIPRFDPPAGLSPADCGFILKQKYVPEQFSAALVDIAVKKGIVIHVEEDGVLFKSNAYTFNRGTNTTGTMIGSVQRMYNWSLESLHGLRATGKYNSRIADLSNDLSRHLKNKFQNEGRKKNGLFSWNSGAAIWGFILLIILAFVTLFTIAKSLTLVLGIILGVIFLLSFIMQFIFYKIMPAYTKEGRKILDEILGFKMYLKTAEERRFDALNPPEKNLELFEKFLPYAIALECQHQWADKFESMLQQAMAAGTYRPTYYSGNFRDGMTFSSISDGISSGLSSTISSASTPPSSSSGGSSGGGSSGGGGGGGGGGGW